MVALRYLVAQGTLDDRVYPMLTEKLKALDTVVDNKNDRTLEGEKQHVVYEDLGDALDEE